MTQKTILTCALPYANGPIHLGHVVEYVLADVHVRYLRSAGEDVVFLCADDTHGAPIELNALKQGLSPQAFVARWAVEHWADIKAFQIKLRLLRLDRLVREPALRRAHLFPGEGSGQHRPKRRRAAVGREEQALAV